MRNASTKVESFFEIACRSISSSRKNPSFEQKEEEEEEEEKEKKRRETERERNNEGVLREKVERRGATSVGLCFYFFFLF